MAKITTRSRSADGVLTRVSTYFKETRAEVGRVTWPTREQAVRLTGIVLAVTVSLAVGLALVDYVFAWVIGRIMAYDMVVISIVLVLLVGAGLWRRLSSRHR